MKILGIFSVLMLSLHLIGCATKVQGLKVSDSFTYPNLINAKMIIGGVANTAGELQENESISFANAFRTAAIEEREDLNLEGVSILVNKMGKDAYWKMIQNYKDNGGISPDGLLTIKKSLTGYRYIVFVRLETDNITKTSNETEEHDKEGNSTGKFTITKNINRYIVASVSVYDLASSTVVWDGQIKKSGSETNNYTKTQDSGLVTLVKAIKGSPEEDYDKRYPYPTPVALQNLISNIGRGFAENLPEKN